MTATFDELYREVSPERREQLLQFRATHPYKHLTVGDVAWEYIACGEGEQALLLLGGGISVGETAFRRIVALKDRVRIVSPSYPVVSQMALVADGLAAILDAEGIQRAHVFGHSLGSAAAHVFVRRHPERVDKLALSGFGIYNQRNARRAQLLVRLLGWLPFGVFRAVYMRKIRRLLAGAAEDERAFMLAYCEELFRVQDNKATAMARFKVLFDLIDNADVLGVFVPVERPGRVLIIAAEDDAGFEPSERETLRSLYPGAQVHTFDSGGHWAWLTRREEYDAVLYEFLGIPDEK
jgi:pimeloyl-ACP methyl ester carboxylesterase